MRKYWASWIREKLGELFCKLNRDFLTSQKRRREQGGNRQVFSRRHRMINRMDWKCQLQKCQHHCPSRYQCVPQLEQFSSWWRRDEGEIFFWFYFSWFLLKFSFQMFNWPFWRKKNWSLFPNFLQIFTEIFTIPLQEIYSSSIRKKNYIFRGCFYSHSILRF